MSLQHSLLVLLSESPATGYELSQTFKKGVGYFWKASHQQIYLQLKKLSEVGWLEFVIEVQRGKPDKKIYQITEAGKAVLNAWLSSEVKPPKTNDALLVMIYGGKHVKPDVLIKEIERHKSIHSKGLKKLLDIETLYLSLSDDEKKKYRLPYLTLRRGISGEQSWLVWAEEVLIELMSD